MTETIESIRYTADVVCLRGDDVLLIRRGWPPHQGELALPGGHVDPGETSRTAAARELLEETGIRVLEDDLVLVGVYDRPGRDPRGRYVSVAYTVTVPAGTTARAGDDAAAVQWVPLSAPGAALAFDHGEIVHAARQQRTTGAPEAAQPSTPAEAPALNLPAINVPCPACGSAPGALCTSHNRTRLRRHDVHQARTALASTG
jgi:8-oxo-dGTP diphosphatase